MESPHGVLLENKFREILKKSGTHSKSQSENTNSIKQLCQKSFRTAVNDKNSKGKSLSKLLIDGFDEEQIWQQSDILNNAASSISEFASGCNLHDVIPKITARKSSLVNGNDTLYLNNGTELSEILKKPETSSKSQYKNTDSIKQSCEESFHAAASNKIFKGKSLSKLHTDGFDEEQIWQQSDLLNKAASIISVFARSCNLNDAVPKVTGTKSSSLKLDAVLCSNSDEDFDENEDSLCSQDSSAEEQYAFDDDSDSPTEYDKDVRKKPEKVKSSPQKVKRFKSIVDDKFFKLSKLEEYLRIEDIKEERLDEDESESEIDLFQDIPSDSINDSDEESDDDDDDDEREKIKKSSRNFMYEDFFGDPESEVEDENNNAMDHDDDDDGGIVEENTHYSGDEGVASAEMHNDINMEEGDNVVSETIVDDNQNRQKSAFELQQEKIKKKILEYESRMLQPMPWHLTGEVAAGSRPVNSLIHKDTEFDSNTKQDLLVDKDLTEKIEQITIMAIMNKAYFDVERKYKTTEDVINYKKEIALEQTKSKKSLAEIYEEDYLKKQNKQVDEEEKEDPKHKEIKKLMDSLFPQLHALFTHIPKPAIPEIKIVSNLPAITVEEVAPTSVSDAVLLAPGEVKKKSGLIKGETERTDTDRKRERRKKKVHQKLKEKKRQEKLESLKANPSAKLSKLEKLQTLKKLKQHKNTKLATIDEGLKIKSSKDFFSRLQDTVDAKNKPKNKIINKKKTK